MQKGRVTKNALTLCVIGILFGIILVPIVNTNNIYTSSITKPKNTVQKSNNGNILYVGGTGPNNYTRIQDAINDTSDGDTVFVYNGIYYENITIDKMIDLVGEDRNSTIIKSDFREDTIHISTDYVCINGFTIENNFTGAYPGRYYAGIHIFSDNNTISDNIIIRHVYGIRLYHSSHNIVSGNVFAVIVELASGWIIPITIKYTTIPLITSDEVFF